MLAGGCCRCCLVGLLLLALLSNICRGQQCPPVVNEEIQRCVLPVAQYAKVLNVGYKTAQSSDNTITDSNQVTSQPGAVGLPNLGAKVFQQLCSLIREFDVCVKEARRQCPRHITLTLIESSYGFLCNEGYDTFMKNADCLMELDQQPAVKKCHDNTLQAIKDTNQKKGLDLGKKMENMCNSLNYFATCVKNPVRQKCGVAAWSVIFRVLRETTQTLMPGCAFDVAPGVSTNTGGATPLTRTPSPTYKTVVDNRPQNRVELRRTVDDASVNRLANAQKGVAAATDAAAVGSRSRTVVIVGALLSFLLRARW